MCYSTFHNSLEAGPSKSSTYFQPTNIRHKYVCSDSSRYSRRRCHRVVDNENEKDGNIIANALTRQRECPPLKVRMSISLFNLLFGLVIFLAILPDVGCLSSPSFVEPKVCWFARAFTSVVAAVTGASIAGQPSAAEPSINVASTGQPSAAEPSINVASTDNSIPPSPADNSSNNSSTNPNPPHKRKRGC